MEKLDWAWQANLATMNLAGKNYQASRRTEEARLLAAITRTINLRESIA